MISSTVRVCCHGYNVKLHFVDGNSLCDATNISHAMHLVS